MHRWPEEDTVSVKQHDQIGNLLVPQQAMYRCEEKELVVQGKQCLQAAVWQAAWLLALLLPLLLLLLMLLLRCLQVC